jgi:predicted neuraminidase
MRKTLLPASLAPLLWLATGALTAIGLLMSAQAPAPMRSAALPHQLNSPASKSASLATLELEASGRIPQPADAPAAHASNLLALPHDPDYALASFWFAGSKEAAPDVGIAMSLWSRSQNAWTPAARVVDRHAVGSALGKGILRIGNPVAWLDRQQRLHVFVVGTGLGGWAASRVLHLRQSQAQLPLNPLQPGLDVIGQLPLGWLWNLSHLVRHSPLALEDGGMVLPLYFEMGVKYPVFAWFNADGEFQAMHSFTGMPHSLQPALLALNGDDWLAVLRTQTNDGHIGVLKASQAGKYWQQQADLPLSNDDSAVAAMRLPDNRFVMLRNPAERGRSQLLMHTSTDGLNWSEPQVLEDGVTGSEFSYPALSWADNRLWLSYTHLRQGIAWQRWRIRTSPQGQP